ncbi:MAG TPA: ABC transporter substrate-binding protein [Chloroflexota bacterium]|jgi:ABC-type nitrate/sulfonate/bicarbonate transport system substrate-binding protein
MRWGRGYSGRLIVGVLLTAALLAACASPTPAQRGTAASPANAEPDRGAATAPAPAAEPPSLQKVTAMGSNITFAQIALPVAKEAGLFEKYGLDAEIAFGQRGVPALIAGEVQFATGGDDVIGANLNGANLAIIATMVPYVQHKFMARPEIQMVADLKGKPVGVSRRGSYPHNLARLVARRGGLDPERDLVIVEIPDTSSVIAALSSGAIVGAPIVPPFTDIAEANGARVLYDFAPEKMEYAVASLLADRGWAAGNEPAVLGFLKAIAEAEQMVHTQPDFVTDVYTRWTKTSPESAEAAVALAGRVIPIKMLPTRAAVERVVEMAANTLPAAATADPAQFYDDSYVKWLEAEGFYDRLGAN